MAKSTKKKTGSGKKKKDPHRVSRREVESLSLVAEPKSEPSKPKRKKKKVTFWSLPKPVRQHIYRLTFVSDEPLDEYQNQDISVNNQKKIVPAWFEADARVEREAAPIHFGENRFHISSINSLHHLSQTTWPRHFKYIRTIQLKYKGGEYFRCEFLRCLQRLKQLDELSLIVDEREWFDNKLHSAEDLNWSTELEVIPQLALRGYYFPGVSALLGLSGIRSVKFLADPNANPAKPVYAFQGPLANGFFETILKPRLMGQHNLDPEKRFEESASFRFLDLPPELRNRIYKQLLVFPGGVVPSTNAPSSVMGVMKTAPIKVRAKATLPDSALKILTVCRQIHDEAVGIFYGDNNLHFHFPIQLSTFLLNIGPDRMRFVRDVTLIHSNRTEGSIQTFDSAIRSLRALRGLKRLEVILPNMLLIGNANEFSKRDGYRSWAYYNGPDQPTGLRSMMTLRGLSDVRVRDLHLERQLKIDADTGRRKRGVAEATKNMNEALQHMNALFAAAQKGRFNKHFFDNGSWHLYKRFPAICDCKDRDTSCDGCSQSGKGKQSEA